MGKLTKNEILERVNAVFRDIFDDDTITVSETTTANDIEDWDSLGHINFNTVGEVEQMLERCRLSVKSKIYGIANGVDFDKAVKKKHTTVPAYVLGKL